MMLVAFASLLLTSSAPAAENLATHFVLVGQAASEEVSRPYLGWTRDQLDAERTRLEASSPSVGVPIALLAGGGGLIGGGAVVLLFAGLGAAFAAASSSGSNGIPIEYFIFSGTMAGVGVVAVIVGIVLLLPRLKERKAVGRQIDQLDEELKRLAPADLLPPQASRSPGFHFGFTLARF